MDELYQRFDNSLTNLLGDGKVEFTVREEPLPVESLDYLLPGIGANGQLLLDCAIVANEIALLKTPDWLAEFESLMPRGIVAFGGATVRDAVRNAMVSVYNSSLVEITHFAFDSFAAAFSRSFSLESDKLWGRFSQLVEGRTEIDLEIWRLYLGRLLWAADDEELLRMPDKLIDPEAVKHYSAALLNDSIFGLGEMVDQHSGAQWANPYSVVVVAYVLRRDPPLWEDFKRKVETRKR